MTTLNIGVVPLGHAGVAYYRMLIPCRKMTEVNPNIHTTVFFSEYMNNIGPLELETLEALADNNNIIYVQRRYGPAWREMFRTWHRKGAKIIYDLDDAYEKIPLANLHPGYREMTSVKTTRDVFEQCFMADLVTVATPQLRDWVIRRIGKGSAEKVVYRKNTLDFSMWPEPNYEVQNDEEVVIGYAGSTHHVIDLPELGGALHQLLQRYGERVFFGFMGFMTGDLWTLEPQVAFKEGVGFLEYPEALASLRFQIGLIPSKNCFFNDCKSELKYLEYSALGIPSILSATAPYIRVIGESTGRGMLVNNKPRRWMTAIARMIEMGAEERRKIGQAAHDYVFERYNIDRYVDQWIDVFEKVVG